MPLLSIPCIFPRQASVVLMGPIAVDSNLHSLNGEVGKGNREPMRRLVCVDIVDPLASEGPLFAMLDSQRYLLGAMPAIVISSFSRLRALLDLWVGAALLLAACWLRCSKVGHTQYVGGGRHPGWCQRVYFRSKR